MSSIEDNAKRVLCLLESHHNVLLSGPPGTGKTSVLNAVRSLFKAPPAPPYLPNQPIALPATGTGGATPCMPAPLLTNRKVFSTVFHQGSKNRDFLRGLVPKINDAGAFIITNGTLYRAAEHARRPDSAALLIIDEINRGPAVQIFGEAIVGMERDKRLDSSGILTNSTAVFETFDDAGAIQDYSLPEPLYLLASMNAADTSVEPLDVAFLRRWAPCQLQPNEAALKELYSLNDTDLANFDPDQNPCSDSNAKAGLVLAWRSLNRKITMARGPEFCIGHGMAMSETVATSTTGLDVFVNANTMVQQMLAHVSEVMFGDDLGLADLLSANKDHAGHPFRFQETMFAGEMVSYIERPGDLSSQQIGALLVAIARDSEG